MGPLACIEKPQEIIVAAATGLLSRGAAIGAFFSSLSPAVPPASPAFAAGAMLFVTLMRLYPMPRVVEGQRHPCAVAGFHQHSTHDLGG